METSKEDLEAAERDFARTLQEHVAEWKTLRMRDRTRTAAGVKVERRFRRRPAAVLMPPKRSPRIHTALVDA